jgi:hypothetical protein
MSGIATYKNTEIIVKLVEVGEVYSYTIKRTNDYGLSG